VVYNLSAFPLYVVIHMAVVGLAKTLSIELAHYNITVNNVCPGRMLTDSLRQGASVQEKKMHAQLLCYTLLRRYDIL
jgi:NAD(P)-dependent dehydrogenase (short-subunit alcohol dehydrogenase family)